MPATVRVDPTPPDPGFAGGSPRDPDRVTRRRRLLGLSVVLFIFYLLHNDLWWWNDATRVLGLPVGLTFHIAYALASAVLMGLFVRLAWPSHLEGEDEDS